MDDCSLTAIVGQLTWLTVNLQLNDRQLPKINVGAGELLFAMP